LTTKSKLWIITDGNKVATRKRLEPEDFIREMRGTIKKGSRVKRQDPLKLKEIWLNGILKEMDLALKKGGRELRE
jgi:hypothetical protein